MLLKAPVFSEAPVFLELPVQELPVQELRAVADCQPQVPVLQVPMLRVPVLRVPVLRVLVLPVLVLPVLVLLPLEEPAVCLVRRVSVLESLAARVVRGVEFRRFFCRSGS